LNQEFLLNIPALAIAVLADRWNGKSCDDQPVSKPDRANRKELPNKPQRKAVLDMMSET